MFVYLIKINLGVVTVKPKDPGLNSEKLNKTLTTLIIPTQEKPGKK